VPQTNPASSDVLSRKPLQSLMRGMNRYHFPDPAFGPRN
jgi:hypothetical protein